MKFKLFAFIILAQIQALAQERITISGFVKEHGSQEQLPRVNIYISGTSFATATNTYGFYSLTVPVSDSANLLFSYIGYEKSEQKVSLRQNATLNVFLSSANQLKEVVVSSRREEDYVSRSAQMSKIDVPIQQIRKIPSLFGEKDILKVLQLMPGVQKGTEGQTGLYVRGGGPDQNLIILDEAVVYNANHLFGFFSVFNSDAIKSVELTKGGFPARYGGRLSSVLDMKMKEGSQDKLHGEGGIGVISSRLTLEGPLSKKRKSSFLISGRRTYIDVLAAPFIAGQQKGSESSMKPGYFFYDLNAKMNYDLGPNDKVYISGYFGRDRFHISEKRDNYAMSAGLDWGNTTATMRWNHVLCQKMFVNTSLIYSNFDFGIASSFKEQHSNNSVDEFGLRYVSRIRDLGIKTDFDFYPSSKHAIKFGIQATMHKSNPSALSTSGTAIEKPQTTPDQTNNALETGIYVEDTWQAGDALKLNAGFRLSAFKAKTITYIRPEPRFSAALRLIDDLSLKASYSEMNQYVHLLSNTGLGLPTDLWVPTTDRVAPQHSKQAAIGFAKDMEQPALTFTLEGYYKKMNNILSYKEGSSFLKIDGGNSTDQSWEDNITAGKGWSYGAELLVQKRAGRLSGWIGYTLAWTKWQFPELNFGKTFYPRYDRRNDLSVVGIYELTHHITFSATWVYGTGNALTLPISKFSGMREYFFSTVDPKDTNLSGMQVTEYAERGNFRAEAFHRLDMAIQFRKKKKRYERTWEFGVYNAYNRKNPFFYDIESNSGGSSKSVLKKYSLFPVLPSISYNFKF
ncbi:MAG: TonB-dependent receptor [Dyadobacter sp.]|uniref:TonB-dependent receptor n=1 Tax=Dyadobacter sp. TaxID=1914288 RepID=UPI00326351E7